MEKLKFVLKRTLGVIIAFNILPFCGMIIAPVTGNGLFTGYIVGWVFNVLLLGIGIVVIGGVILVKRLFE